MAAAPFGTRTTMVAVLLLMAAGSLHAAQEPGGVPDRQAVAQTGADPRLHLAVAVGVTGVWRSGLGEPLVGAGYLARAGWRVNARVSVGAEFGFHGLNDEAPRDSDIVVISPTNTQFVRVPKVVQTRLWLGYVQYTSPSGFFVRPAFGLGFHSYAFYAPRGGQSCVGSGCYEAREGREGGLALSVTAGWKWRLSPRLGLSAEGLFVVSSGEDSSGSRRIFGVQIGPVFAF